MLYLVSLTSFKTLLAALIFKASVFCFFLSSFFSTKFTSSMILVFDPFHSVLRFQEKDIHKLYEL